MPTLFRIIRGATRSYAVQCYLQGGVEPIVFAPSDTFTCTVSKGQDQASLFAPVVSFFTGDPPRSQSGYEQGQIAVAILAADSATLEPGGAYWCEVWSDQLDTAVAAFALYCEAAPGTATQAIVPYCTYPDMLLHAGWIARIASYRDSDQEGFYTQRLEARKWLDNLILSAWAGTGWVPFGDPGSSMTTWSGGTWPSMLYGESNWLRGMLTDDRLSLRPEVVKVCAWKAIGMIGLGQVSPGNDLVARGQYFDLKADQEVLSITAEIDTSEAKDGTSFLPIPLGSVRVVSP